MGFEQVVAQYAQANRRQIKRQKRQGRDFHTKAEQAALKFYTEAIQKISWPAREGTKISTGDLHAENPDMRGSKLDELPANSGDPSGGTKA